VRVVSSQDETAPVPNYRASDDSSTDFIGPPPDPTGNKKRSLFGPNANKRKPPDPGTKDFKPPRDPRPVPPIPRLGFAPGVEKMYGAIALAAMAFDVELAACIMQIAPEAAKAWDELARRNITVRRILVSLMETTAWGAVFAAHLPLFVLMTRKVVGNDPRFSALGQMLGQDAEDYANSANPPEEPQE
jgi:hypothetical protein